MSGERETVLLSVDSFNATQVLTSSPEQLIVPVRNGRIFEIVLPSRLPILSVKKVDDETVNKIKIDLSRKAGWNFLNRAQSVGHRFSLAFIVENWNLILDSCGLLSDSENSFCFPEVCLNRQKRGTPDFVGYGGNGHIICGEIGTKGKESILRSQIYHLRNRTLDVPVFGFIVYYSMEDKDILRIRLAFLED